MVYEGESKAVTEAFERREKRRKAGAGKPSPGAGRRGYDPTLFATEEEWEKYSREYFPSEEKYQEWREGGQGLADYLRGTAYGPKLGLKPGIGYTKQETEDWFGRLRGYSAYFYNKPGEAERYSYWMRAAQLGLRPQDYVELAQEREEEEREWSKQYQEWEARRAKVLGYRAEGDFGIWTEEAGWFEPAPEKPKLHPDEEYMFGRSDIAPINPATGKPYVSIPPGIKPTMGGLGGQQTRADLSKEWFRQNYPSIAGAERGGARPRPTGWRDIITGSGRYAPKIKTVEF